MSSLSWLTTSRQCLASTRSTFHARTLMTSTYVPKPRNGISTPADFLKAIGRSMDTKYSTEDWAEFWKKRTDDFKEAGVAVKDRKYLLWCMKKYKIGLAVGDFAKEPPPKKKYRGWGPAVQDGKRIRSRVEKAKSKAKARARGGN